jgi:hypothetical protein
MNGWVHGKGSDVQLLAVLELMAHCVICADVDFVNDVVCAQRGEVTESICAYFVAESMRIRKPSMWGLCSMKLIDSIRAPNLYIYKLRYER